MRMKCAFSLYLIAAMGITFPHRAQTGPELTRWRINPGGVTGFNGLSANVTSVRYSANFVYPASTGIPDFTIGPWPSNPNTAGTQTWLFKIPRNPAAASGTHTATSLGAMAILVNGVPLYNALDGRSYNNLNVWHSNAVVVEAVLWELPQSPVISILPESAEHPAVPQKYCVRSHRR